VGIVGSGWIAGVHADVLGELEDVVIAGVAGRSAQRVVELARRCGATAYPDAVRMLEEARLDALVLCTPPADRGVVEVEAASRGVHLLVEKPIGLDGPTPERVAGAIRDAGIVAAVGYQWRYLDLVDRVQALLAEHPARMVLGTWLGTTPSARWWVRQAESGGQLLEQATHVFDLARTLVGEYQVTAALGMRASGRDARIDILDAALATLRFDSGAVGSIASTRVLATGHRVGLEIFCDGLAIDLRIAPHGLEIQRASERTSITSAYAFRDPYRLQDQAFIDAVGAAHEGIGGSGSGAPGAGSGGIRSTYQDALLTHRLALRASELAAETG
jgi:predicted dehydrogenase